VNSAPQAAGVLVGLSMGGRIVVEATLAAPERVRALVLLTLRGYLVIAALMLIVKAIEVSLAH
jgi:pimeloyl-ACP methyl ester carboxylesterase